MIHKDGGKIFYTGIRGLFKCPYVVVTDNNLSCDDTRLCVNTYTIFDDYKYEQKQVLPNFGCIFNYRRYK